MDPAARIAAPRGRPPAASRDDVLAMAMSRYLRGERVDIQAIAARLGLGRTTIHRWFGSREQLLGEVLVRGAAALYADARERSTGSGAAALLQTFDGFNRALAGSEPLHTFLRHERDAALRVMTADTGPVHPRIVEMLRAHIDDEVRAGTFDPPVDPSTLAYAIVRLGEAFLFNDAAGIRGDVDRLRDIEAALLGIGR